MSAAKKRPARTVNLIKCRVSADIVARIPKSVTRSADGVIAWARIKRHRGAYVLTVDVPPAPRKK